MSIIAKKAIKTEVLQYIERADDRMLSAIHAMLKAYGQDKDWFDISEAENAAIEEGMQQLKEGKGISHEEVVKKYSQWFAR